MSIIFDIETTGLNPYTDSILTIQFKQDEELIIWKVWEMSEPEVLCKFIDKIKHTPKSVTIYGYNCLKFDIPFLFVRLNHYGLLDEEVYKQIYDKKWLDLYQYMGDNYMSMDRWLDFYGIQRTCIYSGGDIPRLYIEKNYYEIEAHAIDDLVMCGKLLTNLDRPSLCFVTSHSSQS